MEVKMMQSIDVSPVQHKPKMFCSPLKGLGRKRKKRDGDDDDDDDGIVVTLDDLVEEERWRRRRVKTSLGFDCDVINLSNKTDENGNLPTEVFGHSMEFVDGKLVVVGGYALRGTESRSVDSRGKCNLFQEFELDDERWEFSFPFTSDLEPVHRHVSGVIGNHLIVFGRGGSRFNDTSAIPVKG
eukprot:TRINITY_DN6009_c0_g1_i1.p1 TRINITY_DN6009_c0_g1~~TRINITY_DN6009_c0_g1_i1.p1  ORF type:complete len:184 (-),score=45.95 TRINITY_DN6009_c0_g1_i1:37-588(-)